MAAVARALIDRRTLTDSEIEELLAGGGRLPRVDRRDGTMPEYAGYAIELIEEAPSRWCATIQRADGKMMKSLATGETFLIWKCPHATVTAQAAIEDAKAFIDGYGLGVADD